MRTQTDRQETRREGEERRDDVVFRPHDPATQTRPRGNPERHEADIDRGLERFASMLGR